MDPAFVDQFTRMACTRLFGPAASLFMDIPEHCRNAVSNIVWECGYSDVLNAIIISLQRGVVPYYDDQTIAQIEEVQIKCAEDIKLLRCELLLRSL